MTQTETLHSRPRNAYPGDTGRVMTASHYDIDGRLWPAGTEYTPLSAGSALRGRTYQRVDVDGKDVRFEWPR